MFVFHSPKWYGLKLQISQLNLTFREIIYNYRKQPQCKPQDHVDVITFYNELFIPAVKPLLVELAPAGIVQKSSQIPEATNNNDKGLMLNTRHLIIICSIDINMHLLYPSLFKFLWQNLQYYIFVFTSNSHLYRLHQGQCPGSPKVSKFPSLPDMSPKKVSAVHNVYVSPLRSSKVLLIILIYFLNSNYLDLVIFSS